MIKLFCTSKKSPLPVNIPKLQESFQVTHVHIRKQKLIFQLILTMKPFHLSSIFISHSKISELEYKRNLSDIQLKCLSDFKKNKPFAVVTECDKNIGVALISNSLYTSISLTQLSDSNYFIQLDYDPLNETNLIISNKLNYLLTNKLISKSIFKKLFIPNPKLGSFRFVPKLHKSSLSFRLLLTVIDHPTSNICSLIDFILQPFVIKCESYIQDSRI